MRMKFIFNELNRGKKECACAIGKSLFHYDRISGVLLLKYLHEIIWLRWTWQAC